MAWKLRRKIFFRSEFHTLVDEKYVNEKRNDSEIFFSALIFLALCLGNEFEENILNF